MLNVEHLVDMEMAGKEVCAWYELTLFEASKINKFGFKYSEPFLFNDKVVNNELDWLLGHIYISELDKASNNIYFIRVDHIKKQTLERLNSPIFLPCLDNGQWSSIEEITGNIRYTIQKLTLNCLSIVNSYPTSWLYTGFIKRNVWISNAFGSIYINIVTLITIATMSLLEEVR